MADVRVKRGQGEEKDRDERNQSRIQLYFPDRENRRYLILRRRLDESLP